MEGEEAGEWLDVSESMYGNSNIVVNVVLSFRGNFFICFSVWGDFMKIERNREWGWKIYKWGIGRILVYYYYYYMKILVVKLMNSGTGSFL